FSGEARREFEHSIPGRRCASLFDHTQDFEEVTQRLSAALTSGGTWFATRARADEVCTSARRWRGRSSASAGCAFSEKKPSTERREGPIARSNVRRSSEGDQ